MTLHESLAAERLPFSTYQPHSTFVGTGAAKDRSGLYPPTPFPVSPEVAVTQGWSGSGGMWDPRTCRPHCKKHDPCSRSSPWWVLRASKPAFTSIHQLVKISICMQDEHPNEAKWWGGGSQRGRVGAGTTRDGPKIRPYSGCLSM